MFAFLVNIISNLKTELAEYLSLAEGVTKIDILDSMVGEECRQDTKLGHSIQDCFVLAIFSCLREDFQSSVEFI